MTTVTQPTSPQRTKLAIYLDLVRWNRPAGWLLLLWPTLSALWLAAGGFPGWHLLIVFTLGTILMRFAGCCVNDVADRELDRHVKRTAERPVTTGELGVPEALAVGAVLAFAAFLLALTVNSTVIVLCVPALVVALIYPFAKRVVSIPQAVLGVAFSFGIPMAWAGVHNAAPPLEAWLLLVGNLFWVIAYDTEYAMVDRDDDLRLGMKTSAITFGRFDVPIVMACYAAYLLIWLGVGVRHVPPFWFYLGMAVATAQVIWHYTLIRSRERATCFRAFTANHWVGASVFAGIVLAMTLSQ